MVKNSNTFYKKEVLDVVRENGQKQGNLFFAN